MKDSTMRISACVSAIALLLCLPSLVTAQRVVIKGATPQDVIQEVNKRLSQQGFKLEDSSEKQARFGLDRGLVSQTSARGPMSVPVVVELHLRFKQKDDGLEVNAYEEVVGARDNRQLEFRKPVRSRAELDTMQTLLDEVKKALESRLQAP